MKFFPRTAQIITESSGDIIPDILLRLIMIPRQENRRCSGLCALYSLGMIVRDPSEIAATRSVSSIVWKNQPTADTLIAEPLPHEL